MVGGESTFPLNLIPVCLRCKFIFAVRVITFKAVFGGVVLEKRQRTVEKRRLEGRVNANRIHSLQSLKFAITIGALYQAVNLVVVLEGRTVSTWSAVNQRFR